MIKIPKIEHIKGITNKIIELPQGVRACDINNLDNEECDIMLDLSIYGRRSRGYYARRDTLNIIRRLKTRRLVVSVCVNGNYAYDLSPIGYKLVRNAIV